MRATRSVADSCDWTPALAALGCRPVPGSAASIPNSAESAPEMNVMATAHSEFATISSAKLGASPNSNAEMAERKMPIDTEYLRPMVSATAPVGTSVAAIVIQKAKSTQVT
jgi:hypothetical protein